METTQKTKLIKKALVAEFGQARVQKGTGTASHWISSTVYTPHVCSETDPCRERSYASNPDCRKAAREADKKASEIARKALEDAGAAMSTFCSDDGYGNTYLDCHSINVVMTK